ncbi:MAG: NAD(P)-dependent dehydrogenase (short-subunit alcohol dehydrogenase family) [Candidatus Azotimanducaceae bacterium]|jgi:NAD(P)-dependent dehydrogenase (short-subunit alcohol dehydrogenase family)
MTDMKGKVVLITGGSRGLGRAMALAFAGAGADIAIIGRKIESCLDTAKEVEALGRKAFPYAAHVANWEQIDTMVEQVYKEFGKVDVLVNNAGMSPLYPSLDEVTEELFDKVIGVNLKGPFRLSANVGRRMMAGEGGSIINISSTASVRPSPHAEPYGAAKAGLNALTLSFAHAYGPKVRVNCIMAGPFLTDVSKAWDMDAFEKRAEETIPLQRGGRPEEITGAALYLASDMASFTTGAVIAVDGGAH